MKIFVSFAFLLFTFNSFAQKVLHIYGGKDQEVYLGCLNCNDLDANSIWNALGKYGSNISSASIWNDISTYGSDISIYSPWNDLASNPPIIVDKDGGFYGFLTTNNLASKRAEFRLALSLYKYHNQIKDDVSTWYRKLFN